MGSSNLTGACIVGQSGGPTAVINSSVLGVVQAAMSSGCITKVLGAKHGIKGILADDLCDLGLEDAGELELLRYTPASILGTCRYKLKSSDADDTDYKKILETFQKHNVRYFFYIGGNDSMDTCNKISKYMQSVGYDCRIMGVPKTIDNDLNGTDCCPGFGSAAKYIASTCMEVYRDASVYDTGAVTVIEIMGRNAGWLTASAALATFRGAGPDLIYLPETAFDIEKFMTEVSEVFAKRNNALIAVSEGLKDSDGVFISEYGTDTASYKDAFGHAQMGGLASTLTAIVKNRTGIKVRGIELSLLQRCATHLASAVDSDIAYAAGKCSVESAVNGSSDKMVAFERVSAGGGVSFETKLVDLSVAANAEKKVPLEWINESHNGLTREFIDYAMPLIQGELSIPIENGLPRHANLKLVKA